MLGNFKDIHLGKLIAIRMQECEINIERAAKFLKITEEEVERSYEQESIDSHTLLRWSKLLKYDFFRIFTQHLILYSPPHTPKKENTKAKKKSSLPNLKKNVYTQEIVDYLVELVQSGKMTTRKLGKKYNIPNTTILRWVNKASAP